MVDRAIALEKERLDLEGRLREKRRTEFPPRDRSAQRPRFGSSQSSFRPSSDQGGRGYGGGGTQHPGARGAPRPAQTSGYTKPSFPQRPSTGGSTQITCFACGKPGHKSYECPAKQNSNTPARTLGTAARGTPARGTETRAHLNHLTEEDAREAPEVVIGTYPVNGVQALVLFDSGATGSFVFFKVC